MAVPFRHWHDRARAMGYTGPGGLFRYAVLRFVAIPSLNHWLRLSGRQFQHYSSDRDRSTPLPQLSTKILLNMKQDDTRHGWWETVQALPIRDGVIFDVGANVGVTSIWLAGIARQVFAFEPTPESQELMREQLALRRVANVELVPAAVSDASGTATLLLTTSSMTHSLARVEKKAPIVGEVMVETVTLDDFASARGIEAIDLIKIDTEGFEPEVVRGARRLLSEKRVRYILFEYSPRFYANRGLDPAAVLNQLQRSRLRLPDPRRRAGRHRHRRQGPAPARLARRLG